MVIRERTVIRERMVIREKVVIEVLYSMNGLLEKQWLENIRERIGMNIGERMTTREGVLVKEWLLPVVN